MPSEEVPCSSRQPNSPCSHNTAYPLENYGCCGLHSGPLCRHSLDFAHVAMVYGGHLTIVPGNRDRVPTYFGDTAAVIGIASPINAAALLETLRFRDRHGAPPIAWHRVNSTGSSLSPLSLFLLKTSTGARRIRHRAPDAAAPAVGQCHLVYTAGDLSSAHR